MAKAKFEAKPKDLLTMTKFGELDMTMKAIAPLMGYQYEHFSQVIMKNDNMKTAYLTGKANLLTSLIEVRTVVALDADHKQWEKANEFMINRLDRELDDVADVSVPDVSVPDVSVADVSVPDDDVVASIVLELKA